MARFTTPPAAIAATGLKLAGYDRGSPVEKFMIGAGFAEMPALSFSSAFLRLELRNLSLGRT
jgi:hypothetical protein